MDRYATLQAFADELCSTADFDTLADSIERGGIDEIMLRALHESMFSLLAKEDAYGNNAFRRACYQRQFVAARVYLDALSMRKPEIINETIKGSINEGTMSHTVSMTGRQKIIGFLLQNNACMCKTDKNGMTAWNLAVAQCDDCAVGEFADHHVSTSSRHHWYRKRVDRGWSLVLRQMNQFLVKNTELQGETEVSLQGLHTENDVLFTFAANITDP